MKAKNPKVAKIIAYIVMICGLVTFLSSVFIMSSQTLAEIKFSDFYSFILGIFLFVFGVYTLKKAGA